NSGERAALPLQRSSDCERWRCGAIQRKNIYSTVLGGRSGAMSLSRSYKNHDVEVLRAIAILLVVVHHIGYLFAWDGAWQKLFAIATYWGGVDLFSVSAHSLSRARC